MFRSPLSLLVVLVLIACSATQTSPVRCPASATTPAVTARVVEQTDQFADNTALLEPFQPRCTTTAPTPQPTHQIVAIRFHAAGRLGYRVGLTDRVGLSPQSRDYCYLVGHGEEVTAYFNTTYRPEAVIVIPQNPSTGHLISEISSVVIPREVMISGRRVATRVSCRDVFDNQVACEHTVETATN